MKKIAYILVALMLLTVCLYNPITTPEKAKANPSYSQSVNVAVISSATVCHGGSFPRTIAPFTAFNFTIVPVANVNAANLAAYDTILLNVSSTGWCCNLSLLTSQQKADIVSFVAQGKKLIIYDSRCSAQNYSWLPYPFTTNNPGAMGAQG